MTQDMAWLQKGARFQLASQGTRPVPWLADPPRRRNILSTGFFPVSTRSSTRVSAPSSPRDETFLRGLDGESGTAMAEEVQIGRASPSLRAHGTQSFLVSGCLQKTLCLQFPAEGKT